MRLSTSVGLVLTLALLGAGCSPQAAIKDQINTLTKKAAQTAAEGVIKDQADALSKKAEQKIAEGVIKANTGHDVNVNIDQQGASFTDTKTGRVLAVGEKVEIPSGFPKDIPIYDPATPTSVEVESNGVDASLLLVSPDALKKIQDWYADQAIKAGWKVAGTHEITDFVILSYNRSENGGSAELTITLSFDGEGKTNVILARRGVKK